MSLIAAHVNPSESDAEDLEIIQRAKQQIDNQLISSISKAVQACIRV